ncbi:MAG: adenylate/guanylate cyclase domain-containing protein [Acidimicrobiia bacterium]
MSDRPTDPDTRRASALHGDVVGYSRLLADNEIETHNTLQALRRIVEEEVDEGGGELVEFVGDEFLAIVPDPAKAIGIAMRIQRRIASENELLPEGRRMRFRLGIETGDISLKDGQWYGEAINIAARLQALATPGGVNISEGVLDGAGDGPFDVEPLGRRRLKNIPEPVTVLAVVDRETQTARPRPWRRRLPRPSRPSLAVSPFVNLGGPEDSHFADGLMMALVISLMRIPGLDVVSESSTMRYRDHPFSARQLGHELGVRYVLEGAVQRSGDRVRVLTQLQDLDSGTTAWADRFESTFADVFAAQDDIVSKIVATLDIEVIGGEIARMYRSSLDSEGVELVYRGLQNLAIGTPESITEAIQAFREVREKSPDDAMGYDMGALTDLLMALWGKPEDAAAHYEQAEELAKGALDRGDPSGLGNTVLAYLLLIEHDWEGAMKAALRATKQRPSCDLTYGIAASVLRYLGEADTAMRFATRAIRLSPLFATWYETILASSHLLAGDYDEAVDLAESVVAEDDSQLEALLTLAAAQAALGRRRHAAAALEQAKKTRPDLSLGVLRNELPYRDDALSHFMDQLEASGLG